MESYFDIDVNAVKSDKMIFDYIALDESCYAIEVGIGDGQATLPILNKELRMMHFTERK